MSIIEVSKLIIQIFSEIFSQKKAFKGKVTAEFHCVNGKIGKVSIHEKRDYDKKDVDFDD